MRDHGMENMHDRGYDAARLIKSLLFDGSPAVPFTGETPKIDLSHVAIRLRLALQSFLKFSSA